MTHSNKCQSRAPRPTIHYLTQSITHISFRIPIHTYITSLFRIFCRRLNREHPNILRSLFHTLSAGTTVFLLSFFFTDLFYLLIVGEECHCCTWSQSVDTHTFSITPMDEGSAHCRTLYLTKHSRHIAEPSTSQHATDTLQSPLPHNTQQAHCRALYLTTHNRHIAEPSTSQHTTFTSDSHPPARFEAAIPASKRPQTHARSRSHRQPRQSQLWKQCKVSETVFGRNSVHFQYPFHHNRERKLLNTSAIPTLNFAAV